MRVFILSTGRCGSLTFYRACKHIANFTAGHETRVGALGDARLQYPQRHIEVDNRLSWFLGRLHARYANEAHFVHLERNPEAVAISYSKRFGFKDCIMDAYSSGIYVRLRSRDRLAIAMDYVETVNANISHFMASVPNGTRISVDQNLEDGFRGFWSAIGAEGSIDCALAEFNVRHNPSRGHFGRAILKGLGALKSGFR